MKHQIQGQELKGEVETLPFFSSLIQTQLKHRILRKILQEICIPDAGHLDSSEELECQLGNQMKPKQISLFCMNSSESNISILLDLISCKYKPNLRMEKQLPVCSKTTSAHEHFSYGNWSPPFHIPSLIMLQKSLEPVDLCDIARSRVAAACMNPTFLRESIEENAATQKSREKEWLHLVNFGIVAGEDAESCRHSCVCSYYTVVLSSDGHTCPGSTAPT